MESIISVLQPTYYPLTHVSYMPNLRLVALAGVMEDEWPSHKPTSVANPNETPQTVETAATPASAELGPVAKTTPSKKRRRKSSSKRAKRRPGISRFGGDLSLIVREALTHPEGTRMRLLAIMCKEPERCFTSRDFADIKVAQSGISIALSRLAKANLIHKTEEVPRDSTGRRCFGYHFGPAPTPTQPVPTPFLQSVTAAAALPSTV